MYEYRATISRWIDGDTVEMIVDLGFEIKLKVPMRLAGIDTPEIHSTDPIQREAAAKAVARARELCPIGSAVIVKTEKADSKDKYGRWLGNIPDPAGVEASLSQVLINEGLGRPYDGGKKPT